MITGVNRDHLPAYRHVIFQIHDNWRILEGACSGHASHNRGNHWQCQGVSGGPCLTTLCKNQQQVQCSQGAKDCNSFRHRSSPASVFLLLAFNMYIATVWPSMVKAQLHDNAFTCWIQSGWSGCSKGPLSFFSDIKENSITSSMSIIWASAEMSLHWFDLFARLYHDLIGYFRKKPPSWYLSISTRFW